jgi:hypothetical protein
MKAKLIQKYAASTALYEVDPPMVFRNPHYATLDGGDDGRPEVIYSSHVVVHSFDALSGHVSQFYSTIIHEAHKLQGEEGFGYGSGCARRLDGVSQHNEALKISGYNVE